MYCSLSHFKKHTWPQPKKKSLTVAPNYKYIFFFSPHNKVKKSSVLWTQFSPPYTQRAEARRQPPCGSQPQWAPTPRSCPQHSSRRHPEPGGTSRPMSSQKDPFLHPIISHILIILLSSKLRELVWADAVQKHCLYYYSCGESKLMQRIAHRGLIHLR